VHSAHDRLLNHGKGLLLGVEAVLERVATTADFAGMPALSRVLADKGELKLLLLAAVLAGYSGTTFVVKVVNGTAKVDVYVRQIVKENLKVAARPPPLPPPPRLLLHARHGCAHV
jgi:hypothetical protein